MAWQDTAIMAIQIAFALALMPALTGRVKPDRWTCALTGGLLWALGAVMATIPYWLSAGSSWLAAAAWTALLVQRRTA